MKKNDRILILWFLFTGIACALHGQSEGAVTGWERPLKVSAYEGEIPEYYTGAGRLAAREPERGDIRWSVDFGASYHIGKVPKELYTVFDKSFFNKLRMGYGIGSDLHYLINNRDGVGIRFNYRYYHNSDSRLKEKIQTVYVGPSYLRRFPGRTGGGCWILTASAGYLDYKEKAGYYWSMGWYKMEIKEGGFAGNIDFGYDFRITPEMALGIKLSLHAGRINTVIDGVTYPAGTSAIELSGGIRF